MKTVKLRLESELFVPQSVFPTTALAEALEAYAVELRAHDQPKMRDIIEVPHGKLSYDIAVTH